MFNWVAITLGKSELYKEFCKVFNELLKDSELDLNNIKTLNLDKNPKIQLQLSIANKTFQLDILTKQNLPSDYLPTFHHVQD